MASNAEIRVLALDRLAELYGESFLDDSRQQEGVLRELIGLQPQEFSAYDRLATLQEERGFIEPAEETLLAAHHQDLEAPEPYKRLAQFYARRATEMHERAEAQQPPEPTSDPGEPDEYGIYPVGDAFPPPRRLDRAVYPPEAQTAGIDGVVVAEVVIGEAGDVIDAQIVRSVPLLDASALEAVRNWRFEPKLVDGQAVPVRMQVNINFTLR